MEKANAIQSQVDRARSGSASRPNDESYTSKQDDSIASKRQMEREKLAQMEDESRRLAKVKADQTLNVINKTRSGSASRPDAQEDSLNTTQGRFIVDRIETD